MRYLLWIASATVAAGAIVEISTASAADLAPRTYTKAPPPVSAIYDWTGGYVGIEGGFGWGHSDQTDPGIAPPAPPPPPPPPPPAIGDGHYSVSGGLVGGTGATIGKPAGGYSDWKATIRGRTSEANPAYADPRRLHPISAEPVLTRLARFAAGSATLSVPSAIGCFTGPEALPSETSMPGTRSLPQRAASSVRAGQLGQA